MKIIAPSILSADFSILADEIKAVEDAGAGWIHVDVMDGHFVPNITIGSLIVEAAKKSTSLPLDVHLMIENPDDYIPGFASAGADLIAVHAEACTHLDRTIQLIKEHKVRAGVALNPATSLSTIEWVLENLDFVVIMSVNPGFGGQSFIEYSLQKIEKLRNMIDSKGLQILIEIDGGINSKTIRKASEAGVDVFVAGSAIYKSPDYKKTIDDFKQQIR